MVPDGQATNCKSQQPCSALQKAALLVLSHLLQGCRWWCRQLHTAGALMKRDVSGARGWGSGTNTTASPWAGAADIM